MNKSAEQQAEEMYPFSKDNGLMDNLDQFGKQEAFIAGHHSRDEEVKKLVEVLSKIMTIYDVMIDAAGYTEEAYPQMFSVRDKAKEALKPYLK